ncbi:MAG: ferredoxin, partial [Limisphaerales bacterium]
MARLALAQKSSSEEGTGEYFVNDTCIDCDLCRQTAPLYFARKHVGYAGTTYVQRQPLTLSEQRSCRDALEACPV